MKKSNGKQNQTFLSGSVVYGFVDPAKEFGLYPADSE